MLGSIFSTHLVLSPLSAHDAPRLFEYRSDPAVCRYQFFEPASVADARQFIASDASYWHQLGIRMRANGVLAGDVGYRLIGQPAQAEVGITVAPDHQGRGVGTEALVALIGHLFGVAGIHRVSASVDPRNNASMTLFRKVGMRQEGHFRRSVWFKGEWADDVVFAMLADEWSRPTV